MRSTPLEKLVKADLILQVQEQYSKSISKHSDNLDKRIRIYQKRLLDRKLKEELELTPVPDKDNYATFTAYCGFEDNIFDPFAGISGYRSFKPTPDFDAFNRNAKFIDESISNYEEELKRHKKFKDDWKLFLKIKNNYYNKQEINAHLNGIDERLSASFNGNKEIIPLLKRVTTFKDAIISYNGWWNVNLKRDESYLESFEKFENNMEYRKLHPFE